MEFITEWPPPDGPDRIQIDQEEEQPKIKRVKRRKSSVGPLKIWCPLRF